MIARGPSEYTLADVGKAAGIAPATLIQRFGDKRRLAVAAFAQDNRAFAETLASLPSTTGAAAVIAVFRLLTPETDDVAAFADQLLWLRLDMRDPDFNALARERFALLREAVAARLPPLSIGARQAAPEGRLTDYVTRSLAEWFTLTRQR